MKIQGLYCIIPELTTEDEYIDFSKKIIKFNPSVIQLRIKNKDDRFFYNVARKLKKIFSRKKIPFIINDRVDIALIVKSDGVHLGQEDLPVVCVRKLVGDKFIIGISTHSLYQAKLALSLPVDYISIGPVFPTKTKLEYKPVGVEIVEHVKRLAKNKISVVAIGGINESNIELLKKAQPDAVAVVSILRDLDSYKINRIKSIFT